MAFWNSAGASSSLPASRRICPRCTWDDAARNLFARTRFDMRRSFGFRS